MSSVGYPYPERLELERACEQLPIEYLLTLHPTAKATDENLTSENWEYIMDVCDKVTTEDSGAKDAVASMIKRLAHRNANVQLYTLEVRDTAAL